MYENFWQLERKPFESSYDQDDYNPSEVHQGALLKLRYAIENRRAAALLCGTAGVGKSLLVHLLETQLGDEYRPFVYLRYPRLPEDQLLAVLADELTGDRSNETPTCHVSLQRIQQTLQNNVQQDGHAVIAIDETHLLSDASSMETLRLLLNFQNNGNAMFTLLLVGQSSVLATLERTPQLDSCVSMKCLLRPFVLEETVSYINHRLKAARSQRPIFDNSAMEALHHLSRGVPRELNRLADLALLIGFAEEKVQIRAAEVEAIVDELVRAA